jgi:hypothetical protein
VEERERENQILATGFVMVLCLEIPILPKQAYIFVKSHKNLRIFKKSVATAQKHFNFIIMINRDRY